MDFRMDIPTGEENGRRQQRKYPYLHQATLLDLVCEFCRRFCRGVICAVCKRVRNFFCGRPKGESRNQGDENERLLEDETERQRKLITELRTQHDEMSSEKEAIEVRMQEQDTFYKRQIHDIEDNSRFRIEKIMAERDDFKKSKDEALSRLSEMMGVKLRDNNPAITDLNDPNRPMKLGEQFSELYENDWTDAFLALQDMKTEDNSSLIGEEEAVSILLNIIKEIDMQCVKESNDQIEGMIESVKEFSKDDSTDYLKAVKDNHKANAVKYLSLLNKKITGDHSKCATVMKYNNHNFESYINSCVRVCYFAAVQDPPMYLHFEPGDVYDKQVFKEYTTTGTRVKFLVWPALFLYREGPLLSKGVVQPL